MSANTTLRKISLRSIAAHKLRLALTLLAVVLGSAFVAGSLIFTNSIDRSFHAAVSTQFENADAVLSANTEMGKNRINNTVRETIANDPQVDKLNITDSTTVVVGTDDRESLQTGGGVSVTPWYGEQDSVAQADSITEGAAPINQGEVVINESQAEKHNIQVGDQLILVSSNHREEVRVVGLFTSELDTGVSMQVKEPEAEWLANYAPGNGVSQIMVSGASGISPQALVDHLTQTYPEITAQTGQSVADDMSESMSEALSFVNYFLLAFGLIALLVGTFLISNTFSMTVAQRTKEFALLRALGASRRQITSSVVFEAVVVGLVGSLIGVVAGVGLVAGIRAVMNANNMSLPSAGLGLSVPAVVVPLVLGTLVTVVAAWSPSRKAGSVKPVEAMRTTESASSQPLLIRSIIGFLCLGLGIALCLLGTLMHGSTTPRLLCVGGGAVLVIVGFLIAGPAISLPIVPGFGRVIGWPFGTTGSLAATNSKRNPRRTSATAFALILGVSLVTTIGMLGSSMKDTLRELTHDAMASDVVLSGPMNSMDMFPIPKETLDRVKETSGVGTTVETYVTPLLVDGQFSVPGPNAPITMAIQGDLSDSTPLDVVEGTTDMKDRPGVVATEDVAQASGWQVGENLPVQLPQTGTQIQAPLLGTYKPKGGLEVVPAVAISEATASELIKPENQQLSAVWVTGNGEISHDELKQSLTDNTKDLLVVQIMDAEDIAGQIAGVIDHILTILYGLLGLAVIIAILGIINTLTLGVIERKREIGMLRAVGMHRSQVRRMITLEAVQIAVFGAISGMVIGLFLGWSFLKVLNTEGHLDTLSVPWAQLVWMLLGSAVVGVLAAIWPARRAAKTQPLEAIATE